ncbi:MAG: translesion DNA synthesis-associated protein ImuA [Gammaproteobacteria bacterium]
MSGLVSPALTRLPTGFPALDALLGGGWPTGTLTELLVSEPNGAELALLTPALAPLTAASWIVLIAPPWIPYPPGLRWQGLNLDRVLVVRVRQPGEVLWAMEEALRSGACAGVIAWTGAAATRPGGRSLLQRLHLLSGRQQAWAVLVRGARLRRERSPARLRLQLLGASRAALQVEIFRNGWRGTGTVNVERRF